MGNEQQHGESLTIWRYDNEETATEGHLVSYRDVALQLVRKRLVQRPSPEQ